MKTPSRWSFRSIVGTMMMGLVLAATIGSIDVTPVFGQSDHRRGSRYENRGRGHERGYYVHERGRRVYRPYGYRQRAYIPPPVIYAPPPPPGIGIFLPPIPPIFFPPFIIRP